MPGSAYERKTKKLLNYFNKFIEHKCIFISNNLAWLVFFELQNSAFALADALQLNLETPP
jgi:hypothetical protein